MIRYDLTCREGHTFDSWFQSAEAFDALQAAGYLSCAVCGAAGIEKRIMAPAVRPARKAGDKPTLKITMGLVYYKLQHGDKTVQEIDVENMIQTINGTDALAGIRGALAI